MAELSKEEKKFEMGGEKEEIKAHVYEQKPPQKIGERITFTYNRHATGRRYIGTERSLPLG